MTRGKLFATCTLSVLVAKCMWQRAIFFVVVSRPWLLFDRCVLVLKEMDDSISPLHMDFGHALF